MVELRGLELITIAIISPRARGIFTWSPPTRIRPLVLRLHWTVVRNGALVSLSGSTLARDTQGDPSTPLATGRWRGSGSDGADAVATGWSGPMSSNNRSSAKLTDAQLVILSAASQRDDGMLIPPEAIKGAALATALKALLKRGLVEEVVVKRDQPSLRHDEADQPVGVKITAAGLEAIGIAPEPQAAAAVEASPEPRAADGGELAQATRDPAAYGAPAAGRPGSKQALVIDLLKRDGGATLDDLVGATGWLPHTTRAALTGLRQRGYTIDRQRHEGRSIYRIVAPRFSAAGRCDAASQAA